jgi:tetratricopeptide (TPR) repeat protein
MNPFETYDGSKYRKRFYDAVKLYRNSDYEGALAIFREIIAAAGKQDVYRNKYRSYEGLMRVCLGDKHAVELCREVAAEDIKDVEVHYNLALAEYKLNNRRRAVQGVQRGLSIDAANPELLRLRALMGLRRPPIISFLDRDHAINKWLGKLTYRKPGKSRRS